MNPNENAEKLIRELVLTGTGDADKRILEDALAAYDKSETRKAAEHQPIIWRIIMNKPISKIAAAIILVAVFSITFWDKTVTPAWAIEDTIELLARFNGMHFKGILLDEEGKAVSFEAWARANEEQTASNHLRVESATGAIDVVSGNQRYEYDPATATVKITVTYGTAISPWPGPDFFESLQKIALDWNETYGKDPATNRDRVFVTCSHPAAPDPRSWSFEFDVESKLPVTIKQWDNMKREGLPSFNVESVTFLETLPDELFEFEIPEGAKVIPALAKRNKKLKDPNSGMLLGDMNEEQACMEITRRYWQAVIEGNWQAVAILRPISTAEEWENQYSGSNFEEIVEIIEPYQEYGGTIVPCKIRFEGNVTRTISASVLFREIDDQRSCVIVNTWSQAWHQDPNVK